MTSRIDLEALAARVEAAEASEPYALLSEAWDTIHGGREHALTLEGADFDQWLKLRRPFQRMLDAEAYESAALQLVPEGCIFELATAPESATARVFTWNRFRQLAGVNAATPALALCSAALRARSAS